MKKQTKSLRLTRETLFHQLSSVAAGRSGGRIKLENVQLDGRIKLENVQFASFQPCAPVSLPTR